MADNYSRRFADSGLGKLISAVPTIFAFLAFMATVIAASIRFGAMKDQLEHNRIAVSQLQEAYESSRRELILMEKAIIISSRNLEIMKEDIAELKRIMRGTNRSQAR